MRASLRPVALMLAGALVVATATGCAPATSASPSPSPTQSASTPAVDFTEPGAASAMIETLLQAAGSRTLVLAQVSAESVLVSVLEGTQPVTWAYRDGRIDEVTSDLAYVDQASFRIEDFAVSDIGALFATAAIVSGSKENQTLQIVDYSGGKVMMTVTTNPESSTVFFQPSGHRLPELDFNTADGVHQGLTEVLASLGRVTQVGVSSDLGAWVDYAGAEEGTTVRRQRTSKFPVTTTPRSETPPTTNFDPATVDAAVIWQVVERVRAANSRPADSAWKATIATDSTTGQPLLQVEVDGFTTTTTLLGIETSA